MRRMSYQKRKTHTHTPRSFSKEEEINMVKCNGERSTKIKKEDTSVGFSISEVIWGPKQRRQKSGYSW